MNTSMCGLWNGELESVGRSLTHTNEFKLNLSEQPTKSLKLTDVDECLAQINVLFNVASSIHPFCFRFSQCFKWILTLVECRERKDCY